MSPRRAPDVVHTPQLSPTPMSCQRLRRVLAPSGRRRPVQLCEDCPMTVGGEIVPFDGHGHLSRDLSAGSSVPQQNPVLEVSAHPCGISITRNCHNRPVRTPQMRIRSLHAIRTLDRHDIQDSSQTRTPDSKQRIYNSVHNCISALFGEVVASVFKGP